MNQRQVATTAVATAAATDGAAGTLSTVAAAPYKGSFDCAVRTVRLEGPRALYKGFIPTWVRMGPWNIIFFITYEQLKQFY